MHAYTATANFNLCSLSVSFQVLNIFFYFHYYLYTLQEVRNAANFSAGYTVAGIIFLTFALVMYTTVTAVVLLWVLVGVTSPCPLPKLVHSEYEIIAQSACTSMAIKAGHQGWTFAVRRKCDSITKPCNVLCGLQALRNLDFQTSKRRWTCLGAVHVYESRPVSQPSTTQNPSIGFKVYWSKSYHTGQHCGPNYCCCAAA